ncbi:MAG: glutathione peroxidase [Flavicella sp.]
MLGIPFLNKKSLKAPRKSIYEIELITSRGNNLDLSAYKGKKILFVNVASKCGFTPQYEGLERLYQKYKDNFVIIGLPCNQFGKQEPGNNDEILEFCSINYGVSFPISEKVKVKGSNQHPIYRWLTDRALNGKSNSTVKWNFQKYLVDENGYLLDYFYSITKPNSTKITSYLRE